MCCCAICAGFCTANAICATGSKADSRIPYLLITFIYILAAGVMRYWGQNLAIDMLVYKLDCPSDVCQGVNVVYRLMFSLFSFYLVLTLVAAMPCTKNKLTSGSFLIKLVMLVVFTILSFLIPPDFFIGVYYIWVVLAAIFLVIQIVLLVDFAYRLHEFLMEKDMKKVILTFAMIGYLVSLGAFVGIYIVHASEDGCGAEKAFTIVTFIGTFLFTAISVMGWCEHGAVTPSATVCLYCYWLLFSALQENTRHCNTIRSNSSSTFEVLFGLALIAVNVTYAAFKVSRRTAAGAFSTKVTSDQELNVNGDTADDEKDVVSATTFHLTMMGCAAYAAMLMSDWGLAIVDLNNAEDVNGVVYIQMSSQWLAILMYTWSLIAPYVLKNREFE